MLKATIGDIVRHKKTRETYLVVDKTTQGLLVVNLMQRTDPASVLMILPRADYNFEPDKAIVDMTKDEARIIKGQLEIVDAIEETL